MSNQITDLFYNESDWRINKINSSENYPYNYQLTNGVRSIKFITFDAANKNLKIMMQSEHKTFNAIQTAMKREQEKCL